MIIDTNAYVSRWPFRRTPCDDLDRLVAVYQRYGVAEAWVGSLDGLLHRDMEGVNARLDQTCRAVKGCRLLPFGSINPKLPDWKEDVQRCVQKYRMPGIRLHPNYHGYRLDEPIFGEVLDLAVQYRLRVQVVVQMEDTRVQDARLPVPDVDLGPLVEALQGRPELDVMVLNGFIPAAQKALSQLAETGHVWFDLAVLEGVAGVQEVFRRIRADRIVLGSHLPLFCLESALLKMEESELEPDTRRAILQDNARQFLGCHD